MIDPSLNIMVCVELPSYLVQFYSAVAARNKTTFQAAVTAALMDAFSKETNPPAADKETVLKNQIRIARNEEGQFTIRWKNEAGIEQKEGA